MPELEPPYLRSIHPPYRLKPRSAVTLMADDAASPEGLVERLLHVARRLLP